MDRKKLTLLFVLITMMLDAAGFGIIMPVLPDLIEDVAHADIANSARIGGVLMFIFGVTQFVFGPVIGNLSDAFGRRPVLLISLLGMVLDYVIMALAPTVAWLVFGRIFGGITSATYATANAVVTDISSEEEKAVNFGLMGAAFGFGFILGPVIGGVLSLWGHRAPFWGAAVIAAMNFGFGYFVYRESLPKANRRRFEWRRANPVGSFFVLQKKKGLWAFALIYFFYNFAFSVYPVVWSFFTTYQFNFTPFWIAATLALYGISMAISQGLLVGPVIKWLGSRSVVSYGLLLEVAIFAVFAFMQNPWLILILLPVSSIAAITGPAFQDLVTRLVSSSEQGELQGILASMTSLSSLIGTLVMSQSFAYFTEPVRGWDFGGAPFLVSGMAMLIAWMIYYFATHNETVQTELDKSSERKLRSPKDQADEA